MFTHVSISLRFSVALHAWFLGNDYWLSFPIRQTPHTLEVWFIDGISATNSLFASRIDLTKPFIPNISFILYVYINFYLSVFAVKREDFVVHFDWEKNEQIFFFK